MPLPTNVVPPSLGDDVSALISRVKLQELIPNSDVTFTDSQILELMNQELISTIVPLVNQARQEYFVVTKDYQLPVIGTTPEVVNWIELPSEASGLTLRDVYVIDEQGNFANVPRLSPEQVAALNPGVWWGTTNVNITGMSGFYIQGNRLFLYPYSIANGRGMRFTFNRRPARLCLTTAAAQIIAIAGDTVTYGTTLNSWAGSDWVSFTQNELPHDWATDWSAPHLLYTSAVPLDCVQVGSASANTLTFASGVTANLKVGDWVSDYSYSPFAQLIPLEASNLLVQSTCLRLLKALGADEKSMRAAGESVARMAKDLVTTITPRVQGKTQAITIPSRLSNTTFIGGRML